MDRRPRNRDGRPVDPVPFVVVAGIGAMLAFSLGPLYGLAYGLSLRTALTVSAAAAVAIVGGAYQQFVRHGTPAAADVRRADADRLCYLALALGAILLGLSIPLL
ncbi:hypothetical protein ACOZ4L_08445 [Haloplanus ruber]|uniref:Uncharacterized protein n=1 Tax=Haloplanus ruber TaxID=869892 RepID=A0ABD6CYR9_9EURY|nr:hypothetical protein [Haloplanus ruber]